MQITGKVAVNTKEFAAKFRSKNEIYRFVAGDVKAYLPPRDSCTIYFLKSLVTGTKKCKFKQTC